MERRRPHTGQAIGSGSLGIGGGTIVAALGFGMPDNHAIKPWLILFAPTVAVVFGALWLWVRIELFAFVQRRILLRCAFEAKRSITHALANPDISPAHAKVLKKKFEDITLIIIAHNMSTMSELSDESFRSLARTALGKTQ